MTYKLNEREIINELYKITDDMAFDSGISGDSDADDVTPISRQITLCGILKFNL